MSPAPRSPTETEGSEDATVTVPEAPPEPTNPRAAEPLARPWVAAVLIAPGPAFLFSKVLRAQGLLVQAQELRKLALTVMAVHMGVVLFGMLAIVLAHC